ncbi:tubulin domain-containing protein [Sporodiniella umbellata]|nr:tubulin domain-containing protein [Sporodiniella umbellata]
MNTDAVDQLNTSVNNWSDFNRINFHPRSINPIVTHQAEDEVNRFDSYTIGKEAYIENEKETEIFENNMRLFAEECDSLQGFQIMTDVDDAFGGFTEGLLNDLRDEFGKLSIITYGLSDSLAYYRNDRAKQKIELNRIFSLTRLSELSSEYAPYHTSAIIAAAIETNSVPYRLKKNSVTLADSISRLNYVRNTKLATLSIALPFIKGTTNTLTLLDHFSKAENDIYSQIFVTRGVQRDRSKDFMTPFQAYFDLNTALPLPESFPRIISEYENKVPVMTRFESGAQIKESLENQIKTMSGIDFQDFYEYKQTREEFLETKDCLITLADTYNKDDGLE